MVKLGNFWGKDAGSNSRRKFPSECVTFAIHFSPSEIAVRYPLTK